MQRHAFKVPTPDGAKLEDEEIVAMDRLAEIQCPVLVLAGDQDQESIVEHSREVSREISEARVEIIEGGGHMVNVERPAEVNSLIAYFAKSLWN